MFAPDRWKNQVCALLEEGIFNVKAIDPAHCALLTSVDCDLPAQDS